jgi:hypothetical protein
MSGTSVLAVLLTVVNAGTAACAYASPSAAPAPVAQQGDAVPRGDNVYSRIAILELLKVQGSTALDAVRQLRPEFLRATSRTGVGTGGAPAVSVYENGRYLGGVETLSDIPLRVLQEVRRVEPVEAKSMFGSSCPCEAGVILIRTSPPA